MSWENCSVHENIICVTINNALHISKESYQFRHYEILYLNMSRGIIVRGRRGSDLPKMQIPKWSSSWYGGQCHVSRFKKVTGSIHGTKTFLESIFVETHSVRVYCGDTKKSSPTHHFERQTQENLKYNIFNKSTLSRQRKLDILDFKILMEKN